MVDSDDDDGDNMPYVQTYQKNGRRNGGVLKRVASFTFHQTTLS